jgi:uncharacterized protein (PEP-CTERM system associated)
MAAPKHNNQRWPGRNLFALALALSAPTAYAADWTMTPRLDLRETYTDNVTLAPSGSRQSDFVTEISPGVSLSGTGGRLKVNANYSLQNLIYARDSSRNTLNHQFGGNANAELAKDVLFFDASASIRQQNISLLAPIGIDNTSATGNLTTVSTYSLSPYLVHKFGTFAQADARFTYDEVMNDSSAVSDSKSNGVNLGLHSGSAFNDLSWGANYSKQNISYSSAPDNDTESASATLGYRLTPKFRVFATDGWERHNYISASGTPEGSFWSAGFGWAPTSRTSIDASYGRRYFGKTYGFNLSHYTSHTTWSAGYSQDITTVRALQLTLLGTVYYYDCGAKGLWKSTDPHFHQTDCRPLGSVPVFSQSLTDEAFISKRFQGSLGISTGKSSILFSGFNSLRQLQSSATQDRQYGASGSWSWKFAPRTNSNFSANWTRSTFDASGRQDDLWFFTLGLAHQFQPKLHGSLDLRHTQRKSNDSAGDYREEAATAALGMTF